MLCRIGKKLKKKLKLIESYCRVRMINWYLIRMLKVIEIFFYFFFVSIISVCKFLVSVNGCLLQFLCIVHKLLVSFMIIDIIVTCSSLPSSLGIIMNLTWLHNKRIYSIWHWVILLIDFETSVSVAHNFYFIFYLL